MSPGVSLICMTTSEETRMERRRFDVKRLLRDKVHAGKIFLRVDKQNKSKSKLSIIVKRCKDDRFISEAFDTTFDVRFFFQRFIQQFDHKTNNNTSDELGSLRTNALSHPPNSSLLPSCLHLFPRRYKCESPALLRSCRCVITSTLFRVDVLC